MLGGEGWGSIIEGHEGTWNLLTKVGDEIENNSKSDVINVRSCAYVVV